MIAQRPPVTNMYETVIWVSFIVGLLGLWFNLLPFLWPGLSWAWRITSFPFVPKRDQAGSLIGLKADR